MLTAGVDLASQAAGTALCVIRWDGGGRLEALELGLDDARLEQATKACDKVGLDVPLGWPARFAEQLAAYHAGGPWTIPHTDPGLRLRETDRFVWRQVGRPPLSVSSDRIAIPAMRAAHLLSRLEPGLDRTGAGRLLEVYPAAALLRWGFTARGYKRAAGLAVREALLEAFVARTRGWIELSQGALRACRDSDDMFDALVAALVARASACGLCEPVPDELRAVASREGWIGLPLAGSLERLA